MNPLSLPSITSPWSLPLATGAPLEVIGGKGWSLARMASAGLQVPPGFHVTTDAYRYFVQENGLEPILAALRATPVSDLAKLEQAAAEVRSRFVAADIPATIAEEINAAYRDLGPGEPAVAVRSSATLEDRAERSYAGQQESYLNVRGKAGLLDAIQQCWASLWTARAVAYRAHAGLNDEDTAMAVIVQHMAPAEVAGVIFTANALTRDRSELVVNAAYGLGEAIVSGQVTPDVYVIDRTTQAVKEASLGDKAVIVEPGDRGVNTRATPTVWKERAALEPAQLTELAALALQTEALFEQTPLDIEWAWGDGQFSLLQARPVTGLPPIPPAKMLWEPPTPGSAWVRRQVVEHMPEPLSPLFAELYLGEGLGRSMAAMQAALGAPTNLTDELFDKPLFTTINGYAYMRANMNMRWWTFPLMLGAMAVGVTRLLRMQGINYWRQQALPGYTATVARWKRTDQAAAGDATLLAGIRELAFADALYWFAVAVAAGTAKVSDTILERFLQIVLPRHGMSSALFLRGFPSKAIQADADLAVLAALACSAPPLAELIVVTPAAQLLPALAAMPAAAPLLAGLETYLERYGHLIYDLDFAQPTQAESPLPVLLSLQAQVQRPTSTSHNRLADLAVERERLVDNTAASLDPIRRALFRRMVAWAQHYAPYREESVFYIGLGWPILRRLAHELGQRLVTAGLPATDDIYFLTTAEIESLIAARTEGKSRTDLGERAAERRLLRLAQMRLHPPAAVPVDHRYGMGPLDLSSREGQIRNAPDSDVLRGFAVSPGRVTAPASVIYSPAEFSRMALGTILVCPTVTPAWTPLFAQARGLVTDIGGVLAHGSIVAREYGIPAVMGTGRATQQIRWGELITVDGSAGTVAPAAGSSGA